MTTRALDQTPGAAPGLPTTIVTGATSGIGRALALQLAQAGVHVIALGRNRDALRALAAESDRISTYAVDLQEIDALPALAARIVAEHPDTGCLVNNAGIQNDLRLDDARCDSGLIRHEVDVNLVAPMVLTRALLPHLQARPAAWVVNLTSGLGYAPKRTAAVYSATKAGLHLFTRALRVQLQGSTLRVVEAVMPLVDTPMTAGRPDIRVGKARWLPWLQRWAPGVLAQILQRG